jgi:hypothetical protein
MILLGNARDERAHRDSETCLSGMSTASSQQEIRHLQILLHLPKGTLDLFEEAKDDATTETSIIVIHFQNLLKCGNVNVPIAKIGRQFCQARVTLGIFSQVSLVAITGNIRGSERRLTCSSSAMIDVKMVAHALRETNDGTSRPSEGAALQELMIGDGLFICVALVRFNSGVLPTWARKSYLERI